MSSLNQFAGCWRSALLEDFVCHNNLTQHSPVGWVMSSLNQFAGCWRSALLEDFVCHNNLTQHSFFHIASIFSERSISTTPAKASMRLPIMLDMTPPSFMPINVIVAAVIPMMVQGYSSDVFRMPIPTPAPRASMLVAVDNATRLHPRVRSHSVFSSL